MYFVFFYVFFFNDTATTAIYTLSLHDALPICSHDFFERYGARTIVLARFVPIVRTFATVMAGARSEEHTSELQSHVNLVCRLLLEKKKKKKKKLSRIKNDTINNRSSDYSLTLE